MQTEQLIAEIKQCEKILEVNYNTKLMADLKFAQKQLNIVGGENPTKTTRQEIKKYTKEIESGKATWLKDLLEKYGVK